MEEPSIRVKTFDITIETPDGALPSARVEVPDVPLPLSAVVPAMHRLVEGTVKLALDRAARQGRTVSCAKGCGVCCRQLVPLSAPEVLFMAETADGLPGGREMRERFAALNDSLRDNGMRARFDALNDSRDDVALPKDYFFLGFPCPFQRDQACGIHPWRPVVCREFNVTSPAANCADPFAHKIERVRLHRKMTTALARLAAELLGIPAALIPMPVLFEWYEANRDFAVMRWNGIELFELMLKHALGQEERKNERA